MVRQGSGILVVNSGGGEFSLSAAFPIHADVTLPQSSDLEDAQVFSAYLANLMAQSAKLGIPVNVPVQAIYGGQDPLLMATWQPNNQSGDDLAPQTGAAA